MTTVIVGGVTGDPARPATLIVGRRVARILTASLCVDLGDQAVNGGSAWGPT